MRYAQLLGLVALQWVNGRIIAAMSAVHSWNNRLINKGLDKLGIPQDSE